MKKIGIITMYYNSVNYGGLLQSYALQKKISDLGNECFQISFMKTKYPSLKERFLIKKEQFGFFISLKWAIRKSLEKIEGKIIKLFINKYDKFEMNLKNERMMQFRNLIPHTIVYDENKIKDLNSMFDVFICGSDQIWKPGVVCDEFLLKFVDSNKIKASYAASISNNKITNDEIKYLISNTKDFKAISIREKQDSDLFNENGGISKWVLDPTLLLNYDEWNNLSSERLVNEKYMFVYLLGKNKKSKKILEDFAKNNNLKIVNLRYASGEIKGVDKPFGDYNFINIDPRDFISLIKFSDIVITDSFHATVFSLIFNKNFFTIQRDEEVTMENRIKSLLSIFDAENKFIKVDDLLNNKIVLEDKIYLSSNKYIKMKEFSEDFLKNIIK